MKYIYNDGGRKEAGFKGDTEDCVVRAITIATQKSYKEVYDSLNLLGKKEKVSKRRSRKSNSRTGVYRITYQKYLENLGWKWVPTMIIGSGCRVHLKEGELPNERLVVRISKHVTSVVNNIIQDTYNPSRQGTRCVYGYFIKGEK